MATLRIPARQDVFHDAVVRAKVLAHIPGTLSWMTQTGERRTHVDSEDAFNALFDFPYSSEPLTLTKD